MLAAGGYRESAVPGTGQRQKPLLAEAVVEDPVRYLQAPSTPGQTHAADGFWTILNDVYRSTNTSPARQPATLLSRVCEIVLKGPEASFKQVPLGKFGGLITADRREIEAFRAIGALIAEYCRKPQERPLSIAVFGPPGSGKSFGVKQVAKTLGEELFQDITFNLSQFNNPTKLLQALHQVRDVVLTGKIPLVFWDEFDTTLGMQAGLAAAFPGAHAGRLLPGRADHPPHRARDLPSLPAAPAAAWPTSTARVAISATPTIRSPL